MGNRDRKRECRRAVCWLRVCLGAAVLVRGKEEEEEEAAVGLESCDRVVGVGYQADLSVVVILWLVLVGVCLPGTSLGLVHTRFVCFGA